MAIDTLEAIPAGDTTQWIRVRGADAANPVLLLIQQGPGLPMINEARRFEHVLGLEQAFTVVYWDQRGCGRSLRRRQDRAGISLEAMAGDTVSLLDYLRDRFGGKTYVAGFSFGATLGAYAAAQRPDLVAMLVAVGMDIDGAAAGTSAYDFALAAARQRGNRRATRQLRGHRPAPAPDLETVHHPGPLGDQLRRGHDRRNLRHPGARAARQPGALARLLGRGRHPDRPRYQRDPGRAAARASHLDLARTVPRLDVPVVMVQGRHDQVAPGAAAQRYASTLQAPGKRLVWFDNSAHTPHLEEPGKFRDLLLGIREPKMQQDVTLDSGQPRQTQP